MTRRPPSAKRAVGRVCCRSSEVGEVERRERVLRRASCSTQRGDRTRRRRLPASTQPVSATTISGSVERRASARRSARAPGVDDPCDAAASRRSESRRLVPLAARAAGSVGARATADLHRAPAGRDLRPAARASRSSPRSLGFDAFFRSDHYLRIGERRRPARPDRRVGDARGARPRDDDASGSARSSRRSRSAIPARSRSRSRRPTR